MTDHPPTWGQRFNSRRNLCPVCHEACSGRISKARNRVLCLRKRSPKPDGWSLGYWHLVSARVCRCGERHGVD